MVSALYAMRQKLLFWQTLVYQILSVRQNQQYPISFKLRVYYKDYNTPQILPCL
jgi:hypothetical protein